MRIDPMRAGSLYGHGSGEVLGDYGALGMCIYIYTYYIAILRA